APVVAPALVAPPPAANPAPAPVPPAPASVAPASPPAAPSEAENPKRLSVGSAGGFFEPAALLQFWLVGSLQDQTPEGATAPLADEQTLNFRLRRAELRVKGEIIPKRFAYQIMIDPARALEARTVKAAGSSGGSVDVAQAQGALTILQDYFITFMTDYVDISLGQFKIPVSLEGYSSSSKLLFPERAPVSRQFGDKRDIGIRLEKKIGDYFGYSAGIFNGSGQNAIDNDTEKDLALRLEGYPIEGATIAGVGYTTVGKRKRSSRDRLEADLRYAAHDVYAVAEYIHAWDASQTINNGKATEGHGTYFQVGYTLFDHLQPMFRIGDVEPNMDVSGDHYWHYEGGVAWLFHKHEAKIQLAVAHYDPTNPTPTKNPKKTEAILAAQAAF
ncbi:MAG TPA: porin, partial [Polyangiaceae bacterium]